LPYGNAVGVMGSRYCETANDWTVTTDGVRDYPQKNLCHLSRIEAHHVELP